MDEIEGYMEHLDPNLLYEHRIQKEKYLKEFGFKKDETEPICIFMN